MSQPFRRRLLLWVSSLLLSSCAHSSELRRELSGLSELVDRAERNGARRCAPRELAIARSQLEFAEIELEQGFPSKARAHLEQAAPNARAANFLSPAKYCAAAKVSVPKPSDFDADGLLEPRDQCPSQAENFNGIRDVDGCPDSDDEHDSAFAGTGSVPP